MKLARQNRTFSASCRITGARYMLPFNNVRHQCSKPRIALNLALFLVSHAAAGQNAVMKAAAKYSPGVSWRANSIVTADFTCSKRKQTAILGTGAAIVVAVFLNGTETMSRAGLIRGLGENFTCRYCWVGSGTV
jgi:hypothetical protein